MIRHKVDAAFLLRDGFSGKTFTNGSETRCLLDGLPLQRPVWKRDGYLVLTDLAPGEHVLQISRKGYRDEIVRIVASEEAGQEDVIALKPGAGYRFPQETVRVALTLRQGKAAAAGGRIWLGVQPRTRLKLAQEKSESGDKEVRLFCEGSPALLPIPGHFLFLDKKTPEMAYLRVLRGETGEFAPALAAAHARGAELVPMQPYDADEEGVVRLLFKEPGKLIGFCDEKIYEAELGAGEQSVEWKLGG